MSRYEHPAEAYNTALRRKQAAADLEALNAWLAAEVAAQRRARIGTLAMQLACLSFCVLVWVAVGALVVWIWNA